MRRLALALALTAGLSLLWLPSSHGTWADPIMDGLRQTVPTMTPTLPPRTPRPATPTRDGAADTPTSVPPTATVGPGETPTIAGTAPPTQTSAPGGTVTATEVSTQPPERQAHDFGDAPDPRFPSLEASEGARHSVISFEWLGDGVDAETDSRQVDLDLYDDGLVLADLMACNRETVQVEVAVGSRVNLEHPYDAEHLLYLNALVDWDGDGFWSGRMDCPNGTVASEWAVRNLPIDVSSWPEGVLSQPVNLELSVGPMTGETWVRLTLTYGEPISGDEWGGTGIFTYGETEDHLVTVAAPPIASPEVGTSTPAEVSTSVPTGGLPDAGGRWTAVLCVGAGVAVVGLLSLLAVLTLKKRS
jgi:hypothetical protein